MKAKDKRKHEKRLAYDATPTAHDPDGMDGCLEQINRYGTYNVQDTNDTDNVFPAIAQGLPKDFDPEKFSLKPEIEES